MTNFQGARPESAVSPSGMCAGAPWDCVTLPVCPPMRGAHAATMAVGGAAPSHLWVWEARTWVGSVRMVCNELFLMTFILTPLRSVTFHYKSRGIGHISAILSSGEGAMAPVAAHVSWLQYCCGG